MRMEAALQARQEMQMKLAPQVIQSIEILQLSLPELEQRIDEELEENPVLEKKENSDDLTSDLNDENLNQDANEANGDDPEPQEVAIDESEDSDQFERLEELTDYYEKHSLGESRPSPKVSSEKGAKLEALENSPGPEPTLHEHLFSQLSYFGLDEEFESLCENIITNLDDRGYLRYSLEEIWEAADLKISWEKANEALKLVQSLEPRGVGARDIKECLMLQLDTREDDFALLSELISHHFEDITKNRIPDVANKTGHSIGDIKKAIEKIGSLNPRPGSLFNNPKTPHVTPDVTISESEDGYDVTLENAWLPSLRISAYYAKRLQEEDLDDKTREYLTKKLQAAQGIISAIEQRRATLESVTEQIVKAQKEFFDKGEMHIKPLKMQDVADAVGIHVSTVSRAISNKYAQTPRGVYSLKRFFTGGTRKADGDMESWDVVRQKLLQIVEHEDKNKPLSDDAIADKLNKDGIDIARRTVAKYRKNLDIPSSRMRKEY